MFAARKSGVRYMRENGLETCTLYFSPLFRKTQFCTQTCLYIMTFQIIHLCSMTIALDVVMLKYC